MIDKANWRNWLPPCPVVPPLLGATLAAGAVAALHLVFYAEIWTHGRAGAGAWGAALGLLLLAGAQGAALLWRWPPPVAAPGWARWLWQTAFQGAAIVGFFVVLLGAVGLIMMLLISNK